MTSILRHQFGRERREAILFSLCVSILNDNVFPLHILQLTQTQAECLDTGRRGHTAKVSYPMDFRWLLRVSGTEKRKEHGA